MPQESQLAHRVLSNTALPYITNVSPSNTDPHYVSGSSDILTSINGYAERRPGFATAVEATPTVFNNLQRLFTWDRFDGTFIEMACDINASGFAQVYKRVIGSDASFVSIFTDVTPAVFDFVVSNNTVYFSNGNVAQKWEPLNGLSLWGIATPTPSGSVAKFVGTGANRAGGPNDWTNPTNIQGAPDTVYATRALTAGPFSTPQSSVLLGTNYAFGLAAGVSITGIQVVITGLQSNTSLGSVNCVFTANLFYLNQWLGSAKLGNQLPSSAGSITLGGMSDSWGTVLTPTIVNDSSFGIGITARLENHTNTSPSCTWSVDAVQMTVFENGSPGIAVSGAAGSFTATAGYQYVYCYGNSTTGHISSPSLPSVSTGVFTNKANVAITLTASTDPQVNQIRLFRTTDGGGGTYFELPTSPYPNSSGAVNDSAPDATLQVGSIAPTPTFNDPPTPMQGMVYFSGRIWGFSGNKVYFSGLEEINQGVPEESFPSGQAGNFFSFDEPVQAIGLAGGINNQVLGILCGGRVYAITGNTLDTFRRFLVSQRRGARNRACISMMGGMMAWLDSANQVWASDGNTLQELSIPIRPDLTGITQSACSLTFHTAGRFHWLVLSTGTKLFVYDIDLEQWMPPWNFSCNYIFSGEISPGNYVLMAATTTKALQLSTTAFNDNGVTYAPVIKTNLLSVVPDFGSRFSYIASGIYNEPTRTGVPWTFQITNNGQALSDVLICQDEDPTQATYQSIASALQDTATTYNRKNGIFMKQNVYPQTSPASRWIGMKIVLANADQADNIYEICMAYKPLGGR